MKKLLLIFFSCLSLYGYGQFITNTNGITIANSTVLSTNGDWQNTGPVRNDGKIITSAAWTNSGTFDKNSTGGFILNYTTNQSFSLGSNSTELGFIEKNGTGMANVSGKLYVRDSMKIASGVMKVSIGDTLGLLQNTLINVVNGSYVDGPMAKKTSGTSTVTLPLGTDGNYLPITFYNSTSKRVGATVESVAAGFTPGDAVQSLFGFPYVWKTTKAINTDTARFIEVKVPDALVPASNIVVTRQSANQFESMGTKVASSTSGFTSFKSYDRGLKGAFSLGIGYSGDPVADSLELIALYQSTKGASWTNTIANNKRWTSGEVIGWFGVTQKGGRIVSINLSANKLDGPIPQTFTELAALKSLDVSSNYVKGGTDGVTSMPDLTSMPALTVANVSGNNLDFNDLEANASIIVDDGLATYDNQAPLTDSAYLTPPAGTSYPLQLTNAVGGTPSNLSYQWKFKPYFGGTTYVNAPGTSNQENYTIPLLNRATIGKYKLEVQNSAVPGLTLSSDVFDVDAVASISGTLKFRGVTDDPA
ncbi:MAG TPA: hypothetical protein VLC28_13980, partial [Flavitalea sp.]|nr:hypothetical protein [Flavitalea sp.]